MKKITRPKKKELKRLPSLANKPPWRVSVCAIKCRHVWCDGYNTGYEDGKFDVEPS